jgi:hypothetical protein
MRWNKVESKVEIILKEIFSVTGLCVTCEKKHAALSGHYFNLEDAMEGGPDSPKRKWHLVVDSDANKPNEFHCLWRVITAMLLIIWAPK